VAAVGDDLAIRGRAAQRVLARLDRARKDAALHAIADAIGRRRAAIAEANAADLAQGRDDGLSAALLSAVLIAVGMSRLSGSALKPTVTLDQVQRDKVAAKEMVR